MPNDVPTVPVRSSPKKKYKKPYVVEWRSHKGGLFREWSTFGKYKSEEIAESVVKSKTHADGKYFEYRVKKLV